MSMVRTSRSTAILIGASASCSNSSSLRSSIDASPSSRNNFCRRIKPWVSAVNNVATNQLVLYSGPGRTTATAKHEFIIRDKAGRINRERRDTMSCMFCAHSDDGSTRIGIREVIGCWRKKPTTRLLRVTPLPQLISLPDGNHHLNAIPNVFISLCSHARYPRRCFRGAACLRQGDDHWHISCYCGEHYHISRS